MRYRLLPVAVALLGIVALVLGYYYPPDSRPLTNWLLTLTEASAFLLLLLVITPLLEGLYRHFFSTPRLEVSVDSVVSTSDRQEIQKNLTTLLPPIMTEVLGRGGSIKTQAL